MAFKYKKYEESDEIKRLADEYNAKKAQAPGSFAFSNQAQLDALYGQISNRKPFSYDPKGDAFASHYADLFRRQGKLASADVMGQAAALTGGYGNSYATSAANQAYNTHMQEFNNMIPELYELAYSKYQQKGQDMLDQYALLESKKAGEYSEYQDSVSRYRDELALLAGQLDTARENDYARYLGDREAALDAYGAELDYTASIAKIEADLEEARIKAEDGEELDLWNYSKTQDDDGNFVYYSKNGKKSALPLGVNPYNGEINKDILDENGKVDESKLFKKKNGEFSNTYQPNNVEGNPLKKTNERTVVNGRDQAVWTDETGNLYVWDGSVNQYRKINWVD